MLVLAVVLGLGFFDMAGVAGRGLVFFLTFLFGGAAYALPVVLVLGGMVFFVTEHSRFLGQLSLAMLILVLGISGLLAGFDASVEEGGKIGYLMAAPLLKLFDVWVTQIIFIGLIAMAALMFWWLLGQPLPSFELKEAKDRPAVKKKPLFKRIFAAPDLKVKTVPQKNGLPSAVLDMKKAPKGTEPAPQKQKANGIVQKIPYVAPSLDLLDSRKGVPLAGDIRQSSAIIKKTLENFGIPVEMSEANVGPSVTQFTLKPAEGIKLSKITALSNDLALALASQSIRIEAPIPGKALVGIEVPNKTKAMVGLRELLEDRSFHEKKNNLTIALGKDVSGAGWCYDITRMPHLLVAGATNSGKSVCLNAIIVSLLYQNNPENLRLIMVDPKRVELTVYDGIPHLMTPVITKVDKTINALRWCLNEMDRRFDVLQNFKKRNIQEYNKSSKDKMPYIVFIVDELADLMVTAGRDIETSVIRLAQMARAVGIHLILATQRPSVDVITGLIKANMPTRIAFSVASGVDSKTILDSLGAEKLLGKGDMLFQTPEIAKPRRLQGAFVSDGEIYRIVSYIKEKAGEFEFVDGVTEPQRVRGMAGVGMEGGEEQGDDLAMEAASIIVESGKASATFLQRKLSVGYARAAKILDILEEMGVVGPANGSKPREIMMSKEQYVNHLNNPTAGAAIHDPEESEAPEEFLPSDSNSLGEAPDDDTTVFKAGEKKTDEIDEDIKENAEAEAVEDESDDFVPEKEDNVDEDIDKPSRKEGGKPDFHDESGMFFSR